MSMSFCKLDKSRPFIHEKYRKLVMKKDLMSEAYGKMLQNMFFCKLNYRLQRCLFKYDFFQHSYNIWWSNERRENTSSSHFQDLFWWSSLTWLELLPGLIMATQNYPTCIAWKCTQYCYIHGTQILKQIYQCKKGLSLERCSKVSIDTIKERKKTIMSTIGLKELEI